MAPLKLILILTRHFFLVLYFILFLLCAHRKQIVYIGTLPQRYSFNGTDYMMMFVRHEYLKTALFFACTFRVFSLHICAVHIISTEEVAGIPQVLVIALATV